MSNDSHQLPDVSSSGQSSTYTDDEPARKKPKIRKINARITATSYLDTANVNFVFDVNGIEEVVPAHKCMLAFYSPVFRQMLYGELKEKGDIKLTDTTVDAFVDLMVCMHEFQFQIEGSQSKITPLLELAHKYDVNWLEKECKRILNEILSKNVISTLWVLPLADLYCYGELRQRCIRNIHKHSKSIIKSVEFVDCEMEMIVEILGIDFVGRDEVKVFASCIKWAERACEKVGLDPESPENIREQLGDCFDWIRFDSMTANQFMQCLSIKSELFTLQEIQHFAKKLTRSIHPQNDKRMNNDVAIKQFEIESPFNTVESSLDQLLEDQSTADITFVFKNTDNQVTERISAHKFILATRSTYFDNRFKDKTQLNDEIAISGVSAEVFMYFLRLLYVIKDHQFFSILKNIDDQHIDALLSLNGLYLEECSSLYDKMYENYLVNSLNEQNVIRRFELSRKHSLVDLKTKCLDLMKKKCEQIITSETFMDCSQENLKTILELRFWDKEKSLAGACVEWAKKYCKENKLDAAISYDLRTALGDAFELIPFSAMDPMEFLNFQGDYGDLFTGDELKKIAKQVTDRRFMKKT